MDSEQLSQCARSAAMTQSMLMFSLGPVQSFIAQARKTRDLWLGSFLLSTLMEAAMAELEHFSEEKKIEKVLVFPTKREIKRKIPDLPNKYVAIFDDKDQAIKAAKRSIELIEERWETFCKDVWEEVVKKHATKETETIWKRQVK